MIQIQNLTDSSDQITAIQLQDGSTATLELIYLGAVQRWVFNLTHPDFPNGALQGQMLCQHPNILRQFRNVLDFGMACVSSNGNDPVQIEDFANGNITIFMLDSADVTFVEQNVFLNYQ